MVSKSDTTKGRRKVFIRGLALDAYIGIFDREYAAPQPIRVDVEMDVAAPADPGRESMEDVVCYDQFTQGVKAILAEGHIRLVETLAARIAELALDNPLVTAVRVRVEKPDAVPEAEGAGAEIQLDRA